MMASDLMLQADKHELTVEIFDSFEAAGIRREEWDQFVLEVAGDIYVTYDWCRIWWRHYGQRRQLRIFIFRADDGVIAGIAPMFVESIRLGPVKLKLAKRVGADFGPTVFSLPLVVDHAEVAFREIISRLIENEECDAVWFGFMPGNDQTLTGLRNAYRALSKVAVMVRDAPAGPHTVFRLAAEFDLYLATLTKNARQNYRRNLNLIKKNFRVKTDVLREASQATEAFEEFKILHGQQWQAEGKLGHFGDWPGSNRFNIDLVSELSRLGRFRIIRIMADGIVVVSYYAFVFGDRCYWRLPARVPAKEWDRFALGRLGLVQLIKSMIDEGVRWIEGGIGHYNYKLQVGGEELDVRSVLLASAGDGKARRTYVFLRLSDLLHLIYYRIWFVRLRPHLTFTAQPLWQIWIRSRL